MRPNLTTALIAFLAAAPASAAVPYTSPEPPSVCAAPAVPYGAELVAFGSYEADTLSTAYVGGPEGETNLTEVWIEPGKRPLYLVLKSHEAMIWRFRGATERVAGVVVSSGESGPGTAWAGVAGLPRRRVTVLPPSCLPNFYESGDSTGASHRIEQAVGRSPDRMTGAYSAYHISFPSGEVSNAAVKAATPAGFDPVMWQEAIRFWPGGVAEVDPSTITADVPVGTYAILPSQAGLAQWIGKGAIRQVSGGLRVVAPLPRFPPQMGGAHAVRLVLGRGVPMPAGDPGHSCVVVEETGASTGAICGLDESTSSRRIRDAADGPEAHESPRGVSAGLTPFTWLVLLGSLALWVRRRLRAAAVAGWTFDRIAQRLVDWAIDRGFARAETQSSTTLGVSQPQPQPAGPSLVEKHLAELLALSALSDSEPLVLAIHRLVRELRTTAQNPFDPDLRDEIDAITGRHLSHAAERYRRVRTTLEGAEAERADALLRGSLDRLADRLHELRDQQHARDVSGIDEAARFIDDRHARRDVGDPRL